VPPLLLLKSEEVTMLVDLERTEGLYRLFLSRMVAQRRSPRVSCGRAQQSLAQSRWNRAFFDGRARQGKAREGRRSKEQLLSSKSRWVTRRTRTTCFLMN
jgi:hypothetical protein